MVEGETERGTNTTLSPVIERAIDSGTSATPNPHATIANAWLGPIEP